MFGCRWANKQWSLLAFVFHQESLPSMCSYLHCSICFTDLGGFGFVVKFLFYFRNMLVRTPLRPRWEAQAKTLSALLSVPTTQRTKRLQRSIRVLFCRRVGEGSAVFVGKARLACLFHSGSRSRQPDSVVKKGLTLPGLLPIVRSRRVDHTVPHTVVTGDVASISGEERRGDAP